MLQIGGREYAIQEDGVVTLTPEEVSAGVLTELADILEGHGHGVQDGLVTALRDGAAALNLDRIRTHRA